MKHSLHTVLTLLFVCASAWGENVPWQNPQINEINREPAHAHFIPYTNEANALKQQALPAAQRFAVNPATERRISLDGTWKFLFSKNNEECPTDFYKMGYNTKRWKDIQVPGSWVTNDLFGKTFYRCIQLIFFFFSFFFRKLFYES